MKKTTASILELSNLFRTGKIGREQYWRLMRHQHELLRDYRQIVKDSKIGSILIEEHGLVVQLDNGLKFGWNPEDVRQAVSIAINHGDYETTERQILEVVAEGAEVILDVGANCGWYAIHLQARMAPNGIIYAFEPVPKTHEELKANIKLNNLQDKIKEQNIALSDQSGTAVMYLPSFSGSPAASLRNLHEEEENIEVECKLEQLDEFCHTRGMARIDLIKCDVEGAELLVLRGGKESIKKYRPVLFIEILRKWSHEFGYHPNDILNFLHELGYCCWGIAGTELVPHTEVDERTGATNYLFAITEVHGDLIEKLGL